MKEVNIYVGKKLTRGLVNLYKTNNCNNKSNKTIKLLVFS